jgi:hypothetical protein
VQRPHDPEGDQDVPDAEDVAERPGGRKGEDVAQECSQRSLGGPMKSRLTRLAYSLATLVALAAALGAGMRWH